MARQAHATGFLLGERRYLFKRLVAIQDGLERLTEASVIASKEKLAMQKGITVAAVQAIEDEGIKKNWPVDEADVEERRESRRKFGARTFSEV